MTALPPEPEQPVAPLEFALEVARHDGSEIVIDVVGEVDAATGPMLEERLRQLIDAEQVEESVTIRLDLTRMTFIDSRGLTALVTAHKLVRDHGGRLVLARPSKSTRKVLDITGLSKILTTT